MLAEPQRCEAFNVLSLQLCIATAKKTHSTQCLDKPRTSSPSCPLSQEKAVVTRTKLPHKFPMEEVGWYFGNMDGTDKTSPILSSNVGRKEVSQKLAQMDLVPRCWMKNNRQVSYRASMIGLEISIQKATPNNLSMPEGFWPTSSEGRNRLALAPTPVPPNLRMW